MKEELIINKLKENLKAGVLEAVMVGPRRVTVKIDKAVLLDAVKLLKDEFKFYHLSTITGLDTSKPGAPADYEMLYHFANELAVVTLSVMVSRTDLKLQSICALIPGAVLYERELQDMFGIKVEGIPDSRPLVMPDDWPADNYPLRKDWKFERPKEIIPGDK